MACQSGNGTTVAFGGNALGFNNGVTVLGIDMGEESVGSLGFSPLDGSRQIMKRGDIISARRITLTGLMDIADIQANGPDLGVYTGEDDILVSLPVAGSGYRDTGHFGSIVGPNLVNDELMEVSVVFQTSNEGPSRGYFN